MIEVACAVEGKAYVRHCAAMLHSLLTRHQPGTVRISILHGLELRRQSLDRLEGMVTRLGGTMARVLVPDERLMGLPTHDFTKKATWYRIMYPDLLPDADRVLHLDADLIVTDTLAPLWGIDLGANYLAAVDNVIEPEYADRPAKLGLPSDQRYFNAGVMLMDLAALRRDGCSQALYAYGVGHAGELVWRDQDVLNVVLGSRRLTLHPRWNVMNSMVTYSFAKSFFAVGELDRALEDPAVRHFEGPAHNKPWHHLCERDDRELYHQHVHETPWPRIRFEGGTPRVLLRHYGRRLRRRAGLSP